MTKPEIERKYVIRKPDVLAQLERWEMAQTYLRSESGTRRVRMRMQNDIKEYYFTHKERVIALTALETERSIDEEEYQSLLAQRDPRKNTVYKTRYLYPYQGQLFEIDVYPFWERQCVMEIELTAEDTPVVFPPEIEVIAEVTRDVRYKNVRLAEQIPEELI